MLIEEIHDTHLEIHENVDTNIGIHAPALKSNMSISGTGTPRTEHEESEDELEEYVQDLSKDQIFNEIKDARMQDSLREVMVTRDS